MTKQTTQSTVTLSLRIPAELAARIDVLCDAFAPSLSTVHLKRSTIAAGLLAKAVEDEEKNLRRKGE